MSINGNHIPNSPSDRHSIIAKKAYEIAKYGYLPDKSDDDIWYEAERRIDNDIFGQKLAPAQFYKSLMIKFLSSHDIDTYSNQELASNFFDFILNNQGYFENYEELYINRNSFDFRNISILAEDTQLDFLTKRSLLIADTTLLGHTQNKSFISYRSEEERWNTPDQRIVIRDYLTNCSNIAELGQWLKSCKDLLISGDVFYYPKIEVSEFTDELQTGTSNSNIINKDYAYDAIVASKKVIDGNTGNALRTKIIRTIVEIELPYIDTKQMSDFSKISIDERKYLDIFRDCIRSHFLDIISKEGSESFDINLSKTGLKIKEDVRLLTKDIKNLKRKSALLSVGTIVSTVGASLVAIDSNLVENLPKILSTTGALGLGKIQVDYMSKLNDLKNNPYYYLWLLRTK